MCLWTLSGCVRRRRTWSHETCFVQAAVVRAVAVTALEMEYLLGFVCDVESLVNFWDRRRERVCERRGQWDLYLRDNSPELVRSVQVPEGRILAENS